MIPPAELDEQIRRTFVPTERGVVGLVDGLLAVCARVEWLTVLRHDSTCVLTVQNGWDFRRKSDTPLDRPGVFRAALARLAVLCNEHAPDSVSLYGGEGRLVLPGDAQVVRLVSFRNTPGGQWLTITGPHKARLRHGRSSRTATGEQWLKAFRSTAAIGGTSQPVGTPAPATVG